MFSTISLTKSPLFAFAFVWWFGIAYQLHMTRVKRGETPRRLPARTLAAFIASACVMLISAKYAWYILLAQTVIMLIADRGRWKTYIVALLLPAVILHGGLVLLVSAGKVINGFSGFGASLYVPASRLEEARELLTAEPILTEDM